MEMNNFNQQNMMAEFRKFSTKPSIKWSLVLLLSVLPTLIVWIFIGGEQNYSNSFFGMNNGQAPYDITYGYQWLLEFIILLSSSIVGSIIVKFNKEVKTDIFGNIFAFNFLILNFWIFNIGGWRFLTALPMFILGYLVANILRVVFFVAKIRSDIEKFQKGDFSSFTKNMSNEEKEIVNETLKEFQKTNNIKKENPNNKSEIEINKNKEDEIIDIEENTKK